MAPAMSDVRLFTEAFIVLFVIMDPPGIVPVFLGLTKQMSTAARARAARQAVVVAISVVTAFAVFGQSILDYLGISLAALQGAGGLLLLLVALDLLTGRGEDPHATPDVNVAIAPLGTPLLAGPGAIVAVMVFAQQATTAGAVLALAAAVVAVHLCLWAAMRYSLVLHRWLGDSGITLLTRIAGVLLSAIAVQLVAESVIAFANGTGTA
jgi:multiple antibiotic resistance protein